MCASCPFRTDNDLEFGTTVNLLRRATMGRGWRLADTSEVTFARHSVAFDALSRGDFMCHTTVYDKSMTKQLPQAGWQQCPGATIAYKTGKLPDWEAVKLRNQELEDEEAEVEQQVRQRASEEVAAAEAKTMALAAEVDFMRRQGALTREEKRKYDAEGPGSRRRFGFK